MKMTKLSFKRSILQILLIALLLVFATSLRAYISAHQAGKYEASVNANQLDDTTKMTARELHDYESGMQKQLNAYLKQKVWGLAELWYLLVAGVFGMAKWNWGYETIKNLIHWSTWTYLSAILWLIVVVGYWRVGKKMLAEKNQGKARTITASALDQGVLYPRATFAITMMLIGGNAFGSLLRAPIFWTILMTIVVLMIETLSYVSNGGELSLPKASVVLLWLPRKILEIFHINEAAEIFQVKMEKRDDHGIPRNVRKRNSRGVARRAPISLEEYRK